MRMQESGKGPLTPQIQFPEESSATAVLAPPAKRDIHRKRVRDACRRIVGSWGTEFELNLAHYLWVSLMLGVLAALEHNRIGLFLVPPFGATLTILLALPESPIAQPYAIIVGSVVAASVGTVLSLFARGSLMAIVAAVLALAVIILLRAYHPPGVALAMYPLLLHTGHWFPLAVVLPFTMIAVGSAALLSSIVKQWPAYPKPLTAAHNNTTHPASPPANT